MNHTVSLKKVHTFGLDVFANALVIAHSVNELVTAWQQATSLGQPVLILGGGSNTLFIEDFSGTVILNRLAGYEITESKNAWRLHVGAGENWHQLVTRTINQGMPGLENLALIPGCVGSAPIQNIGAYGVEFERYCEYVDVVELTTGHVQRVVDGQFGYRESIFKRQYKDNYAIIAVGISLPKKWTPTLSYGQLKMLDPETITAQQIYAQVCAIRASKLPDPSVSGNAGSFFKNPTITEESATYTILQRYTAVPMYAQPDGKVKVAAAWLIDQCGLKGHKIGGAQVHPEHALILVNRENATPRDILLLARYVREQVFQRFAVYLEPEVRFIMSGGEIAACRLLGEDL